MRKQSLVSVGIPTYNRPKGLQRTLECITQQTYKNLEIIVSDNCSPNPKVKDVVQKFQKKDKRIKYFRQDKNIFGENFTFVLRKSKGEYFMWAADDDSWEKQYINKCINEFKKSKTIALVSTACRFIDPAGKKPDYIDYGINTYKLKPAQGFKLLRQKINTRTYTNSIFYGIYKNNVLKENFSSINVIATDHILMTKICLVGEIITVPVINMIRRRGGISASFKKIITFQRIRSPFLIKFPFFVREIMMQYIIWQSSKITFLEKIDISLFSLLKYLDKFIHNFVNQSVDRLKKVYENIS